LFVLVLGRSGKGKTLFASYLAARSYYLAGIPVASNTPLYFPYKPLSSWADVDNLRDHFVLIDEVNNLIDGRSASSSLNKERTIRFNQYRKQNLIVVMTAQQWGRVDKSIREQLNLLYICTYHDIYEEILTVRAFLADEINGFVPAPSLDLVLRTTDLYHMYDSFAHVTDLNLSGAGVSV